MIATVDPVVCSNRQSWLAARRTCIGASESPAIFGVGYADQSPLTIWNDKVHGHDEEEDSAKSEMFAVGKLMEPSLRSIFTYKTGLPCEAAGEFTLYRHDEYDFIGATLDAWTRDANGDAPVELKKIDFLRDEWKDDNVPLKYQVQTSQQMLVTGTDHAYVFGLLGNQPAVRLVRRNDRFIDALIAKLTEFWGYVQRREMPPVDDSAATARILAKLFPYGNGETRPIEAAWLEGRRAAKAEIKAAAERLDACENKIKAAIGDATFGETPSGELVSWKEQHRDGYWVDECNFRVLRECKSKK